MFDDNFNYPRIPLRKGIAGESQTNYQKQAEYANPQTTTIGSEYRVPAGRMLGNEVFRRNLDGSLDIDNAKHSVIDCLKKQKDGVMLTDLEQLVLSVYFPSIFTFIDPTVAVKIASVQLKLSPIEIAKVAMEVAEHLSREMQYASTPKP